MATLSIEVLGPLKVSTAGRPITSLESVKVKALLAYLAVESDRAHTRSSLVGLLWPDFTEESARHNLRQALFNLRRALSEPEADHPFLLISRDQIQFNRESDYSLDIERFNHYFFTCEDNLPKCNEDCSTHASNLEKMVNLYRGEFLQQLMVDDSTEFEDWLLVKRESLHQRALEAHSYLANYYVLKADLYNARRHATRQLELDPWREEAHRQLMRVLAQDGERSAALAQYETCKRVLAEELDVEPAAETRELYEQIKLGNLNQEPSQVIAAQVKPSGHLPIQLTPFIGRETELRQLGEYLADPECRCLSLVGPGGVGKTRLALQAASNDIKSFADGAAFIPLAPVGSIAGVVPAILNALELSFYDQNEPTAYLLNYLHDKQMVLILDNVEQLLNADNVDANITQLVVEILQSAPRVKLLVTTREALCLQGEYIFDVQGLAFPKSDEMGESGAFDAMTLFVQRARRATPQFALNADNRAHIANICRLVEGMPLAIELAATWMRVLSPAEIAREIESSLDFLSTSVRDLPERHRSMRVVFDHSWQMLSRDEQLVLSKLSVFRGGFQRHAAEQVVGASLSTLSTLVNRSLLKRTASGRYDLHELVLQYCGDQLTKDPQVRQETQARHFDFYLRFAKTSDQELRGPNQLEWLERLELENDNTRKALEYALDCDERDGDGRALELAAALRWFWRMRGHFHEGCDWLTEALQRNPAKRSLARAGALSAVSLLTNGLGNLSEAMAPAEESISIYEELSDEAGLAEARLVAGVTDLWQGEAAKGYARLLDALAGYQKIGDRWGEAQALYRLGSYTSDYSGDLAGRELLEKSAAILEGLGEKYLHTSVLVALGIIDLSRGDYDSAQVFLERSLATTRKIKHPWGIADSLTNLGCLYRIRGDYSAAQTFFEEALDVYQKPASSKWQTDVYCALAENAIVQGDFSTAHIQLDAATSILGASENKWLQVVIWYFRGLLAFYEGRLGEAARLLEEDIPFEREGLFKPDLARSLVTLGRVKLRQGEISEAKVLILDGLTLFNEIGHRLGVVHALEALAEAKVDQGDHSKAVELYAVAHNLRTKMGAPLPPIETSSYEALIGKCRMALGDLSFSEAWEKISAGHMDEIVAEELSKRRDG